MRSPGQGRCGRPWPANAVEIVTHDLDANDVVDAAVPQRLHIPSRSVMPSLPKRFVTDAFDVAARARSNSRVFHPSGRLLQGTLLPRNELADLLGAGERTVVARLSKGVGTPGGLPDVLGLAVRVLDVDDGAWDLALATTGTGLVGRFVVTPARSWASANYGSLMPYRFGQRGPRWVFATPDPRQPGSASLDALSDHAADHPLDFTLRTTGFGGTATVAGDLRVRSADIEGAMPTYFDPVRNRPDGVELLPRSVSALRELAYAGSRSGRDTAP